jgi:hypothetical protein
MSFAFGLCRPVDEHTTLRDPTIGVIGIGQFPTIQILAVKQSDGFPVLRSGQIRLGGQGRNSFASEIRAAEFPAIRPGFDGNEFQAVA